MKKPRILDDAATIADPTRCRILLLLERHELTVTELCQALHVPQSTVSRHLRLLGDAGWLDVRRDGTFHFYRLIAGGLEGSRRGLWELVRAEVAGSSDAEADVMRLDRILSERSSRSQAFFSDASDHWDQTRDELFGARSDLSALPALLDPSWRIADLACGTGRVASALAPFVSNVVAVDASPDMLAGARRRLSGKANVDVRAGRLEALPLESDSLDAALLVLALHHVPEPTAVLSEVFRVLAPSGRLVVVDMQPHDRESFREEMGHVWLGFGEEQIRDFLKQAGFEPAGFRRLEPDASASGPPLFTAVAVRSNGTAPQRTMSAKTTASHS